MNAAAEPGMTYIVPVPTVTRTLNMLICEYDALEGAEPPVKRPRASKRSSAVVRSRKKLKYADPPPQSETEAVPQPTLSDFPFYFLRERQRTVGQT